MTISIETALNAVTATGAGSAIAATRTIDHSLQVTFTGTVTALTIDLEGSLDGVDWFSLTNGTGYAFTAAEITAKAALVNVSDSLVNNVRANITTYTGTGAVTAIYTPGRKEVN